jgi:O-methyltransferase
MKKIIYQILPNKIKKLIDFKNTMRQFTYASDGLYTIHNSLFKNTEEFKKAYAAGNATGSWGDDYIGWRLHIILYFAKKASLLSGDFVECGVNKGGLSKAIIEHIDFNHLDKKFYLFDTFEGFDSSLLNEKEKETYKNYSSYGGNYEEILTTFKDYKNVVIKKGSVPDSLYDQNIEKVSFLSIDLNCVQPETDALNYFWPKMVDNGIIVLDDFAYCGFEDQYKAHTKWAKDKGIEILSLPTGQGLIIK